MHSIHQNLALLTAGSSLVAGAAIDDNSIRIDMEGHDSVLFVAVIEDSVSTAEARIVIEENDVDSGSGMVEVPDLEAVATCVVDDDLNGKLLLVEYRKTDKRYVQCVRSSNTAAIGFGSLIAIRTPHRRPAEQEDAIDSSYVSG